MASEKIRDDAYRAADQLSADAITDADAKLRQARFSDEAKAVRDAHYSAAADVRAVGYRRCITQTPMVMGNAPRLLAPPPGVPAELRHPDAEPVQPLPATGSVNRDPHAPNHTVRRWGCFHRLSDVHLSPGMETMG